ncbi:hypothetical protein YC2023_096145 [Brassica napus]
MAFIGLFGEFLASFCFLIVYYFLNKKTFGYLHIKKTLQSYPWNWPILGCFRFKPERWVSDTGELRLEPSHKFFSFNAGPRTCLGKYTVMTHLKIILVEILQYYDIEVVKGHKIEPLPGLTLHMKHGVKVTLNKRCSA